MNFGDFLNSKRWKLTQNYIYSWGASVVLMGALFKLEHLPGAGVFLGVGLSIEALIFFVSAFEPLMEAPDWRAVYPQLRTGEESEKEMKIYNEIDEKHQDFFASSGGGSVSLGDIPKEQMESLKDSFEKLSNTAKGLKNITDSTVATEGFVKNLNDASQSIGSVVESNNRVSEVMDQSVQEIAKSYKSAAQQMQLSSDNSASGIKQTLSDLSNSIALTAEGLKGATDKVSVGVDKTINDLSKTYLSTANELKSSSEKASSDLSKSIADTASSFDKTTKDFNIASGKVAKNLEDTSVDFAKQVKTSATELTVSYKDMTSSMTNGFKGLEKSSHNYTSNLDKLNKNLTAINTAYELHLKGTDKVEQIVNEYSKGVGEIGKLLNTSVKETQKFNQNTKEINENINALNTVYGKMLGALNVKK